MSRYSLINFVVCLGFALLASADETVPTFSNDVAKIIHDKCASCHRPESSAPFSLISYRDVQQRAGTIEAVLDMGYMPPWKPVDHGIAFANDRSLSNEETQKIKGWIDAGCPEGDRGKTPDPPQVTEGWILGKPDLVVRMNGTFDIPADGPDIYRSFVFPLDLPQDKWVKAVQLRPRAKSSVHHALFFVDTAGNARKMDGADGQTGIAGMGFLAGLGESNETNTEGGGTILSRLRGERRSADSDDDEAYHVNDGLARGLGGCVPGSTPNLLPGDLAMSLPAGSDIVMQTHFHPSGKAETEQAEIALYFAEQPPSRELMPIMVPPMFGFGANIKIPAGEKNCRVFDRLTLPVATRAIGVGGHAHYVCRELKLTAQLPSGQAKILLHIDDWDLDWQDQYLFAEPIDLPADTVLISELIYDNSAENPENPHHPPQDIRWGRGSTDEMGSITLLAIADDQNGEESLRNAVRRHFINSLIHREPSQLVEMLMQLDDNHDGSLQRSETPPRMKDRVFEFVDADDSGALDESELENVLRLRGWFRR
ncbi:hypothetical protein [Neorhodopirellula pilleata]|uniref:EF-hand domain-containing protein n=1 Tax=Neorhodopirellula pilleata TaxID=2714738 RepID=A0A5C6ACS8_9BACT|nr:hypothetical protein [Neorhodopirellula pilleata]TWT97128.1 hypothetical protein Pla100_22770 [Neorhodopirellula pilleata]